MSTTDPEDRLPTFKRTHFPVSEESSRAYAAAAHRRKEAEERILQEAADRSETEFNSDEMEEAMDDCPSPRHKSFCHWTPEYEARRQAKRRPPSPPPTPPHLKNRKTLTTANGIQKSRKGKLAGQRSKRPPRYPPRRPVTRSHGLALVSLHSRKGMLVTRLLAMDKSVMSYEEYLRDWVKGPSSPLFSSSMD